MKREELIAYDKWLTRRKWGTGEIISPEKAADLYLAEHPLPPAEGAEQKKTCVLCTKPAMDNGLCYEHNVCNVPKQQQPTAEGAEEILAKYLIRDPISKRSVLEAMHEFATLHAQQKSEMSIDMVRALREFHTAFNLPQRDTPTIIPDNEFQLRHKILVEEVGELSDAYLVGDIVEVADAITDCLYVLIGTALQFGIADKLEACFDEVHRSNMSKLGNDGKPILREDGKVMKGPNFVRPDLNKVLAGPSDYSVQKSEIKMPTKEAIVQYFNNHFNCHADVIIGDYETTETAMTVDAVLKMIEWLRNQITGQ
jgi:predicted HAD superfamily Cof-like phosphohydrolase